MYEVNTSINNITLTSLLGNNAAISVTPLHVHVHVNEHVHVHVQCTCRCSCYMYIQCVYHVNLSTMVYICGANMLQLKDRQRLSFNYGTCICI